MKNTPLVLTDQDKMTLRTAAYGAVTLLSTADVTGSPHRVAAAGFLALNSAIGPIGHVLADRSTVRHLDGRSAAEIADHVMPALTASTVLLARQDPAQADSFRDIVAVAVDAALEARRGQLSPALARMTDRISEALAATPAGEDLRQVNSDSSTGTRWTGMVPVDDTALAVTDTGGTGIPVVYLNGQFATQGYWRRVIAELGTGWRHITFDERARGRISKRSADYSFEAAVRDVDAVLAARTVDRPVLLVGWSYGAVVGAHWAGRNPDRTLGAILVDGAFPYDWLDEAMEQRIRKLFRRMGWFSPLLRPMGLVPRMSAGQQADSNIELGRLSRERELGPVLDGITVPVRYVVASGTSLGSHGDEQERIRAGLDAVTARNPHIRISAKVTGNHGALLRKNAPAIADAVREVAALDSV